MPSTSHGEQFKTDQKIKGVTLYLTSERNLYGAVYLRWFDGEAKPFNLKMGKYHNIQINEVRRYEYLKDKCKDTSFYRCLGSNLIHNLSCRLGDDPCALESLPTKTKYLDYPICLKSYPKTRKQKDCFNHIGDIWNGKKGECKDLTPCHVQIYGMRESKHGPGMYQRRPESQNASYVFYLDLDSPGGTHGCYSDELKVNVHTEHLAWTFKCLIGNVGGYLGLFVGFSFTGLSSWVLNLLPNVGKVKLKLLSK